MAIAKSETYAKLYCSKLNEHYHFGIMNCRRA